MCIAMEITVCSGGGVTMKIILSEGVGRACLPSSSAQGPSPQLWLAGRGTTLDHSESGEGPRLLIHYGRRSPRLRVGSLLHLARS